MNVELRPATPELLREFFGHEPKETVRALVAYIDGVPAGVGGVTIEASRFVAFCDIRSDMRIPKITIWRYSKIIMEFIKERKAPILAACRTDDLSAQRFVERLGFRRLHQEECGEVYLWS